MKKIFAAIFLAAVSAALLSCKGESGPQGPAGDPSLGINKMVFQNGMQPYSGYNKVTDTWLSSLSPTTTFNNDTSIYAGFSSTTTAYTDRILIKFDVTAVDPDSVKVTKAYLTFRYWNYIGTMPALAAYKMTGYWDASACWVYSYGTTTWPSGGGGDGAYNTTPASDQVTVNDNNIEITLSLDIAMVEDWIRNSLNNYGVIVKNTNEMTATYSTVYMDSSDTVDKSYAPKLTIYYTLQ